MAPNLSKSEESARVFLAIELPPDVKSVLADLQDRLSSHAGSLKLVAPDLIHLTVRFLGMLATAEIALVVEGAHEATSRIEPFTVSLAGVGTFPGGGAAPRVIWVGVSNDGGSQTLLRLFAALEDSLSSRSFARDTRPLSPHLTLARLRDGAAPRDARMVGETVAAIGKGDTAYGSFEVQVLTVMRSDRGPHGPRYTPLARVPLGGQE